MTNIVNSRNLKPMQADECKQNAKPDIPYPVDYDSASIGARERIDGSVHRVLAQNGRTSALKSDMQKNLYGRVMD